MQIESTPVSARMMFQFLNFLNFLHFLNFFNFLDFLDFLNFISWQKQRNSLYVVSTSQEWYSL